MWHTSSSCSCLWLPQLQSSSPFRSHRDEYNSSLKAALFSSLACTTSPLPFWLCRPPCSYPLPKHNFEAADFFKITGSAQGMIQACAPLPHTHIHRQTFSFVLWLYKMIIYPRIQFDLYESLLESTNMKLIILKPNSQTHCWGKTSLSNTIPCV